MSLKWIRQQVVADFTGNFNVEDSATSGAPIVIPGTNAFTKLTNDALGALTTNANAPVGLSPLWDPLSDAFDFSQLSFGDQVMLRFDLEVITANPDTEVHLALAAGIGVTPFNIGVEATTFKSAGSHMITPVTFVTMDTSAMKDGTAEVQLKADKAATVVVVGWNYIVNLRS